MSLKACTNNIGVDGPLEAAIRHGIASSDRSGELLRSDSREDNSSNTFPSARDGSHHQGPGNLEEAHIGASLSKKTPARAVFDDLHTAHSSITSGTARSAYRSTSKTPSDVALEQENSIPLRDLEPIKHHHTQSFGRQFIQDLLLPPTPAILSRDRQNKYSNIDHDEEEDEFPPQERNQAKSLYSNIKNAFKSSSSPAHLSTAYQGSSDQGGSANDEGDKVLDIQPPLPASFQRSKWSGKYVKARSHSAQGSFHEGSTIGNIYKHYAESNVGDEDISRNAKLLALSQLSYSPYHLMRRSSSSILVGRNNPSALHIRRQIRAERLWQESSPGLAPTITLPAMPKGAANQMVASSSRGLGHSSSYGDTQNLLQLPSKPSLTTYRRHGLSRSDARSDLRSDHPLSDDEDSIHPDLAHLHSNNPFRRSKGPNAFMPKTGGYLDGNENGAQARYLAMDRLPLERDVSMALRRASGMSFYSTESISSSILGDYGQPGLRTSKGLDMLRRLPIHTTAPSEADYFVDEETRALAVQAGIFYHQDSVDPGWVSNHQQNAVRVPIIHNGAYPDSPPHSPENELQDTFYSTQEDDATDWETVGESAFRLDTHRSLDRNRMLRGTIRRAGSSIANTSDEGSASLFTADIQDFSSSTDRIAHHPAKMAYTGNYVQRDLKNGKIPVFLPIYREHKVNGYLADSTRIGPKPNQWNRGMIPSPLGQPHSNPFKASPPEDMSPRRVIMPKAPLGRNHFPPSSKASEPSEPGDVEKWPSTWMDDFDEPGPALSTMNSLRPRPAYTDELPSPWDTVTTLSNGGSVPSNNQDGTRASSENDDYGLEGGKKHIVQAGDQFEEVKVHGGRRTVDQQRNRTPFVKGPPGAFYHSLRRGAGVDKLVRTRSQRDPAHASAIDRSNSLRPKTSNIGRANSVRLNKVSSHHRQRSEDISTSLPGKEPQFQHIYRSPLAVPKRYSSRALYTKAGLGRIQNAAIRDGLSKPFGGQLPSADRAMWEDPRLGRRHSSFFAGNVLTTKKTKISRNCLIVCSFFPPLLALYGLSYLDGFMLWWSKGDFSSFNKGHKHMALKFLSVWIGAILAGLIIGLVYYFLHLHHESG